MASMDFSYPEGGGAMIRTNRGRRGRPVSTSGSGMGDIDTSFFEDLARRRMEKEDKAESRADEDYDWKRRQREKRESERRSDRTSARRERELAKMRRIGEENSPLWAQERVGTWGIPTWTPTLEARQKGLVNVSEGGLPGAERKSAVGEIEDAAMARRRKMDEEFEDMKRRQAHYDLTRDASMPGSRRW